MSTIFLCLGQVFSAPLPQSAVDPTGASTGGGVAAGMMDMTTWVTQITTASQANNYPLMRQLVETVWLAESSIQPVVLVTGGIGPTSLPDALNPITVAISEMYYHLWDPTFIQNSCSTLMNQVQAATSSGYNWYVKISATSS